MESLGKWGCADGPMPPIQEMFLMREYTSTELDIAAKFCKRPRKVSCHGWCGHDIHLILDLGQLFIFSKLQSVKWG